MTRATRANLSAIFSLFSDPSGASWTALEPTTASPPWGEAIDDRGTVNRLWRVTDPHHPVPVGGTLTGPKQTIYSLAFSRAGLLAAGSADDAAWLWNVSDLAHPVPEGGPLTGANGPVQSVAFSPDGQLLAAGSADDTVRLWNVTKPAKPALASTLTGPDNVVYAVAFSPDGKSLAAGSKDGASRSMTRKR